MIKKWFLEMSKKWFLEMSHNTLILYVYGDCFCDWSRLCFCLEHWHNRFMMKNLWSPERKNDILIGFILNFDYFWNGFDCIIERSHFDMNVMDICVGWYRHSRSGWLILLAFLSLLLLTDFRYYREGKEKHFKFRKRFILQKTRKDFFGFC